MAPVEKPRDEKRGYVPPKEIAGRPREFWRDIFARFKTVAKPEPNAVTTTIERLPKEQLEKLTRMIRAETGSLADRNVYRFSPPNQRGVAETLAFETYDSISKEFDNLNLEDVAEILVAAIRSRVGSLQTLAFSKITKLPKELQTDVIIEALQARINDVGNLGEPNIYMQLTACEFVPRLPKEKHPELWGCAVEAIKRGLQSPEDCKKANELIQLVPVEYWPELIKSLLRSPYPELQLKSLDRIAAFPPKEQTNLLKAVFDCRTDAATKLKSFDLIEALPEEFKYEMVWRITFEEGGEFVDRAIELIPGLSLGHKVKALQAGYDKLHDLSNIINLIECTLDMADEPAVAMLLKNAAEKLIPLLRTASHPELCGKTVGFIPRFPAEYRMELLLAAADSSSGFVQLEAAKRLECVPQIVQLRLVKKFLKSEHEVVQCAAYEHADKLPREWLPEIIDEAVGSKHGKVVLKALEQAQESLSQTPMDFMKKALQHREEGVVLESVKRIRSFKVHEQIELLKVAMSSQSVRARIIAYNLFHNLPEKECKTLTAIYQTQHVLDEVMLEIEENPTSFPEE